MAQVSMELSKLWRNNVRVILRCMDITQENLAKACGVSRSGISTMLNREDYRLTGIQFLGTMHALKYMIEDKRIHYFDLSRATVADKKWCELNVYYLEHGLT